MSESGDPTPLQIANALLENTGTAIESGDFLAFRRHFQLPQTLEVFERSVSVESESDLRQIFDGMRDYYDRRGVTKVIRNIVGVEQVDEETIVSTHETRLIGGAILLQRPYPVMSVLRKVDDEWVISDSIYAIADSDEQNSVLALNQPGTRS